MEFVTVMLWQFVPTAVPALVTWLGPLLVDTLVQ
jgi:hypothetical protein